MNQISFLTPYYIEQLNKSIQEKPHATSVLLAEKSQKILCNIQEAKLFDVQGDQQFAFYQNVQAAIHKISFIKPGRRLLKRLLAASNGSTIKICETAKRSGCFKIDQQTLWLSDTVQSYVNVTHEKKWRKTPFELILAHELIHALHHYEVPNLFVGLKLCTSASELLDPDWGNLVEQLTICGLLKNNKDRGTLKEKEEISLCENHFRCAWGMELRVNSNGIEVANEMPHLRLDHYLFNKAPEALHATPEAFNQLYCLDWLPERKAYRGLSFKTLCPLSIAILMGYEVAINHIMQYAASSISLRDDSGGPILAACLVHRYDLANKLLLIARAKNFPLDTENLFQNMLQGYQQAIYANNPPFYEVLWNLSQIQKETMPPEQYVPFFQRVLFSQYMMEWIIEQKPQAFLEKDSKGNNLLMALLQKVKEEDSQSPFKFIPITCLPMTKLFLRLLTHPYFDLRHTNLAGETLISIAQQINDQKLIVAIQQAMHN